MTVIICRIHGGEHVILSQTPDFISIRSMIRAPDFLFWQCNSKSSNLLFDMISMAHEKFFKGLKPPNTLVSLVDLMAILNHRVLPGPCKSIHGKAARENVSPEVFEKSSYWFRSTESIKSQTFISPGNHVTVSKNVSLKLLSFLAKSAPTGARRVPISGLSKPLELQLIINPQAYDKIHDIISHGKNRDNL